MTLSLEQIKYFLGEIKFKFAVKSVIQYFNKICAGIFFLILSFSAIAQTAAKLDKFSERLSEDVPVSGRVLVGAYATASKAVANTQANPVLLWSNVNLKAFSVPSVCVTTTSRDGRFYSKGTLTKQALEGQVGPFRVESARNPAYVKYLQDLTANKVAQLAVEGECEALRASAAKQRIVLLSNQANDANFQPTGATILINSERMTSELQLENAPGLRTMCKTISDGMRASFDTECRIEGALPKYTSVKLVRTRYEDKLEQKFDLIWAD